MFVVKTPFTISFKTLFYFFLSPFPYYDAAKEYLDIASV